MVVNSSNFDYYHSVGGILAVKPDLAELAAAGRKVDLFLAETICKKSSKQADYTTNP